MINEEQLEQLAITWFQDTGWNYLCGYDIAPECNLAERSDYREVVLRGRLTAAITKLNPDLPRMAVEEVVQLATKLSEPGHIQNNRAFHRLLLNGVSINYTNADGEADNDHARLVDFNNPKQNDFLVVNQFTITGTKQPRRPDIVVFVNGLPLSVIELKNPADENADVWKAYDQLQTYKDEIGDLFIFNEALVISDGPNANVARIRL